MSGGLMLATERRPQRSITRSLTGPQIEAEKTDAQFFLATLRRVATIFALTMLVIAALSGGVVISSLIGRVEKLESDLGRAQARIVELAASQSRLSASIDSADRSIKSLRSDLDHPRLWPLASILDTRP